jgi:CheY-like chemotaxis protein
MARVLVVEDEETLADVLQDVLNGAGFQVQLARNGVDAWRKIEAGEADLLLLDLMLPLLDGRGLLERLHGSERLRELPVVVLTSASRQALGGQRVQRFLEKPVSFDTLVGTLRSVLAGEAA